MTATATANWTRVTGTEQKFSPMTMKRYFDRVHDPINWKSPIPEQWIPHSALMPTVAAIAFFAGSPTDLLPEERDGQFGFRIKAPGYYACVGA